MNKLLDTSKAKVYKEFVGVLDTYWETGYEGHVLAHLYIDGYEYLNPNYDSKDSSKGPEHYRSYEGILSLDFKDVIEIIDSPDCPEFNGLKFIIGNRDMALKDKFYLGRVYPINVDKKFDLKKWYKLFSGKTKAKVQKLIKKVCFYGGTFDPFHIGHQAIVKELHYTFDEVLVLVNNNWTKINAPIFSLDERLTSVTEVCKEFKNVTVLDWSKNEDTSSTYEMSKKIESLYGIKPYVVIGADNLNQIENWKMSDLLMKEFPFCLIEREGYSLDNVLASKLNLGYIKFSRIPKISSTEIKKSHDDTKIPEAVKKCLDLRKLK